MNTKAMANSFLVIYKTQLNLPFEMDSRTRDQEKKIFSLQKVDE